MNVLIKYAAAVAVNGSLVASYTGECFAYRGLWPDKDFLLVVGSAGDGPRGPAHAPRRGDVQSSHDVLQSCETAARPVR